jgi:hypothetical protein
VQEQVPAEVCRSLAMQPLCLSPGCVLVVAKAVSGSNNGAGCAIVQECSCYSCWQACARACTPDVQHLAVPAEIQECLQAVMAACTLCTHTTALLLCTSQLQHAGSAMVDKWHSRASVQPPAGAADSLLLFVHVLLLTAAAAFRALFCCAFHHMAN